MRRALTGGATALGLAALLLVPTGARGVDLDLALCAPDQNVFTLNIDNPFFPLPVGRQWILVGDDDGEILGLQITVLGEEEPLYENTVTTRVVEEVEWADTNGNGILDEGEALIEVSRNYFAQTAAGTVCYFGEAVDTFNEDGSISHGGAWRAHATGQGYRRTPISARRRSSSTHSSKRSCAFCCVRMSRACCLSWVSISADSSSRSSSRNRW
ncbi:MAG TPA: hypothetical protein VLD61_07740 [Methylomirabilota bacterium]|nr:hypothetical protein [Methylomirabilota bacterium]